MKNKIKRVKLMVCKYCGYEWYPRVDEPKACPRCKRRLDHIRVDRDE